MRSEGNEKRNLGDVSGHTHRTHRSVHRRFVAAAVLSLLALLCACDREPNCVEADDWGYPKVTLSADYKNLLDKDELVIYDDNQYMHYSLPIDSGQMLLGGKTVITLDREQNFWLPFMGTWLNPSVPGKLENRLIKGWWPEKLVPNWECRYFKFTQQDYNHLDEVFFDPAVPFDQPTIALQKQSLDGCKRDQTDPGAFVKSDFYPDCLAPCIIRNGVGLLMAVFPDRKTLADYASMAPGEAIIRHLTDFDLNGPLNEEEGRAKPDGFLVNGPIPGAQKDGRLYFKLADTFYLDDIGGYRVHIKCGTRPVSKGPFEVVTGYVRALALLFTEGLFRNIVEDTGFIQVVRSLIALYIILYAYGFMTGYVHAQVREMALRIVKAGLALALISPTGWSIFYNHFFAIFYSSMDASVGYFINTMPSLYDGCETQDPESPWYTADYVFRIMTSDETWQKVAATLFSNPWGFLFIIAFIIAFLFFLNGIFTLTISYIGSMVGISILFILFPFFFLFSLFQITSTMFENWLRNAISFALEIILSVAMLGMFFQLIINILLRTLGFRVCWKTIFEIFPGFKILSLGFFMPSISAEKRSGFTIDATGATAERYIDIPYFDPAKDAEKIEHYLRNKNFIDIGDIITFLGIVLMMYYGSRALEMIIRAMKAPRGYQAATDINNVSRSFVRTVSGPVFGQGGDFIGGNSGGLFNLQFARSSRFGGLQIKPKISRQPGGLLDNRLFSMASDYADKAFTGARNFRLTGAYKETERSYKNAEKSLKKSIEELPPSTKGGGYDAATYLRHGELFYGEARKMLGEYDKLLDHTGKKRLRRSGTEHMKARSERQHALRQDTILGKPVTLQEAENAQNKLSESLAKLKEEATSGKGGISDATRDAAKEARNNYRLVLDRLSQNPQLVKTPEGASQKGMGYETAQKPSEESAKSSPSRGSEGEKKNSKPEAKKEDPPEKVNPAEGVGESVQQPVDESAQDDPKKPKR